MCSYLPETSWCCLRTQRLQRCAEHLLPPLYTFVTLGTTWVVSLPMHRTVCMHEASMSSYARAKAVIKGNRMQLMVMCAVS